MNISFKLSATVFVLVSLILASIFSTFSIIATMDSSLSTIVEDRLVPMRQLKEIGDRYAINIVDTSHKVRSGAMSFEEGAKSIEDSLASSERQWKDYTATYLTDEERAFVEETGNAIRRGHEPVEELLTIVKRKDKSALEAFVSGKLYPAIDPITEDIAKLVDLQIRVANQEFKIAHERSEWTRVVMIGFSIIALMISAGALWFIFKGVSAPLKLMTGRIVEIADGNLDVDIPFSKKKDEIGAIAGALEIFRQGGLRTRQLEAEAESNRLAAERERVELQQKAEADASERLRIATSGLAVGLQTLASGDLTVVLNEPFASEFEQLRHDFNESVRQLGSALRQVSGTVIAINTGTREIADSSQDLSKRTEQQAAALEETAAALDEITANVSNSAKRSGEAKAVANAATTSATRSVSVVTAAENAMERIEQSSTQISNIIGVIDEIAFQTNLLALNAGVEAARAGEAGKGFAVVAQEVRELAQRSAQAAKEIKVLIRTSSAEVEGGVKLVRETGCALKDIGDFILRINEHVEAIAVSSSEQATGLAQVNIAINQLDQATQKNAAMAEEATAASNSLAHEANSLRELVSGFSLGTANDQSAQILRHTAKAMAQPSRTVQPKPKAQPRNSEPRSTMASARSIGNTALKTDDWEEF